MKNQTKKILGLLEAQMDKVGDRQKYFPDVRFHTDKQIKWTSGEYGTLPDMVPAAKHHLLTVVFDGGGYDYLSCEADYGGGIVTNWFRDELEKVYGEKVEFQWECSWAFSVWKA